MRLFIGSLAFDTPSDSFVFDERLGILFGTFVSSVAGYLWLRLDRRNENR